MIRSFQSRHPKIASTAFVEESAQVIGDVVVGEDASIWFNAVVRGDVHSIRIGRETNIQDNCVVHGYKGKHPVLLGDRVTVAHAVNLHGCVVEDDCLIGIGAIVMNGAVIGAGSIIAAGALVPEGMQVPPGSVYLGAPARRLRAATDADRAMIAIHAANYLGYKDQYLAELAWWSLMTAAAKIAAVKGMRDLLPADTVWFQRLEQAAREVFGLYNFEEIRTPVVEPTALFARAVGEETDIVGKEMYTFDDRDGASLTLRPEATASAVRAYVEHRLWERPGYARLYYMGPMFRRERPQKGRYRQFYQIGAEVMGGNAPWIDFELLEMLHLLLRRCGIEGAELVLNSVGCGADRPLYHAALRAALEGKLETLCADCQRRAVTNPLRVLDCKVPADQPVIATLPKLEDYLDPACRDHLRELCRLLDAAGIAYRRDPRLVRGLDYYTSTAFEFLHGALGSQNALLGGGRYDGLAQSLGAPAQAGGGIGFALGEDRFVLAMQAAGAAPGSGPEAVLVPVTLAELDPALGLAARLRAAGRRVELTEAGRKLGKSLELAARLAAPFAILIGADEAASRIWTVKNLSTGDQSRLHEPALVALLAGAAPGRPS